MKLTEEEKELVLKHRALKAAQEYAVRRRELQQQCAHTWVFEFQNYKTCYYHCPACDSRKGE